MQFCCVELLFALLCLHGKRDVSDIQIMQFQTERSTKIDRLQKKMHFHVSYVDLHVE